MKCFKLLYLFAFSFIIIGCEINNADNDPNNNVTKKQIAQAQELFNKFVSEGSIITNDDKNLSESNSDAKSGKFEFANKEKEIEFYEQINNVTGITKSDAQNNALMSNPTLTSSSTLGYSITLKGKCGYKDYYVFSANFYAETRTEGYVPSRIQVTMHDYGSNSQGFMLGTKYNQSYVRVSETYYAFPYLSPTVRAKHECWYPWGKGYLVTNTSI